MLVTLSIENYALIHSLEIHFNQGMTVITGETGAGKSIMMGALALIQGNRADTSVLFDKSKKCFIEAVFNIHDLVLTPLFEEYGIDYQDYTIIRREISESGRSRAFINDTPVNLSILKEFSSNLIDIHSQHHNLLFQDADFRMNVVDEFAGIRPQVEAYHSLLKEFKKVKDELNHLLEQQTALAEKRDYLQFVYQELAQANLAIDEQEQLEQDIDFLTHTETIKGNCYQITNLLSEKEANVLDNLREVKALCAAIAPYHSDIEIVSGRIESTFIELKDIANEIVSLNDKIDYNPELLELKRHRLDMINSLEQKYRVHSVASLIDKMQLVEKELSSFTDNVQNIGILSAQCDQLQNAAMQQARAISDQRKAIVPAIQERILERVRQLGMPDAQFVVQMQQGSTLQKNGIDSVQYLFSANKGVGLAELEKVASGGEMSRLMLSVKSTISDKTVLPTVVFDEIDVGISGEVAGKVAKLMKAMSQERQLLVITHLPQIAAKGQAHYQVFKKETEGIVQTQIRKLDENERIAELAKMMSGNVFSDTTLQAAKELIEQ